MLHAQELIWRENGGTELGEEMESLLLDPELVAVVNHSDNGDAGLFATDGFFVSFSMGKTCGLVKKKEVGGIDLTACNQIIHHCQKKMSILRCTRQGTSAWLALWTHTQTSPCEVATPVATRESNAECDNAELMGNIIEKGGRDKGSFVL